MAAAKSNTAMSQMSLDKKPGFTYNKQPRREERRRERRPEWVHVRTLHEKMRERRERVKTTTGGEKRAAAQVLMEEEVGR